MKEYKKLYENLKEQFDKYLKHKAHNVKRCKYCKGWYNETIEKTKKIKNKQVRENLLRTWECLWLNNCKDFDIIANIFMGEK